MFANAHAIFAAWQAICPVGRDMHGKAVRSGKLFHNVAIGDISHSKYIAAKPYRKAQALYRNGCAVILSQNACQNRFLRV